MLACQKQCYAVVRPVSYPSPWVLETQAVPLSLVRWRTESSSRTSLNTLIGESRGQRSRFRTRTLRWNPRRKCQAIVLLFYIAKLAGETRGRDLRAASLRYGAFCDCRSFLTPAYSFLSAKKQRLRCTVVLELIIWRSHHSCILIRGTIQVLENV